MAYDTNQQQEVYRIGAQLRIAKDMGLLTDAGIAAAGVHQVVTNVVTGTVGGSGGGNIIVNVRAAGSVNLNNSGNGKDITVAVANNDTATQAAVKIRAALNLDADVAAFFGTIAGTGVNVVGTALRAAANDTTMRINYANSTASGLTNTNSTITTTGADPTTGLLAFVAAAAMPIGGGEVQRSYTTKAINAGIDFGIFTDLALEDLTTVDQLIALTGIPDTYKGRSFYD